MAYWYGFIRKEEYMTLLFLNSVTQKGPIKAIAPIMPLNLVHNRKNNNPKNKSFDFAPVVLSTK